jgi:hypothetical protein
LFGRAGDYFELFNLDPGLAAAGSRLDFGVVRDHSSETETFRAHGYDCRAAARALTNLNSILEF